MSGTVTCAGPIARRSCGATCAGAERVPALPVEYIVETTAKCNLYCPMCPRETHKQPKEDMTDADLRTPGREAGAHRRAHDADRPGRAFHGSQDFRSHRILRTAIASRRCFRPTARFWTKPCAERLLDSPLQHITLSFDGATKETFELYRKGARFEKVRDNFVRFCAHETRPRRQVADRGADGAHAAATPTKWMSSGASGARIQGVDQVRVKEDETNLVQPERHRAPRASNSAATTCGAGPCM